MSTALTKAIRSTEAVANAAFSAGLRSKVGGAGIDLVPSGLSGGLAGWQEQQVHAERYGLMRGWVSAAINAVSSEAASQPAVVARLKGAEAKPEGKKHLERLRMTVSARRKTADLEYEIQKDHPLVDLVERPNPFQNRWQFVYSFVTSLLLTGWSYVVVSKTKGKDGGLELYSLPTTWVKAKHDKGPFTSFAVKNPKAVGVEPAELDRRQVGFAHLPNPADPLAALAPASTQMMAIRVDDHIQSSQEAFFRNGIFPSVIITMAPSPYQDTKGRPVLTTAQRRQIHLALKKRHASDLNQGSPVIIDGLIDKIEPWSVSHREMGWERSEEKVRTRILSAFGVHPFILGEAVGVGGYAQAAIIQERFYKRVNVYLDMLGSLLTNLLGGVEGNERLLLWFEECRADDRTLRQSMLLSMRTGGDISQNELRAEAGFPPDEDLNQAVIQPQTMAGVGQAIQFLSSGAIQREQAVAMLEGMGLPTDVASGIVGKAKKKEAGGGAKEDKRSMLLNSVGGMTGTIQVLTAVGQGVIGREEAASMLALFLQISPEEAMKMVPEQPEPEPVPEPESPPPPETPPEPPGSSQGSSGEGEGPGTGEGGEEDSQGAVRGVVEELKLTNLLLAKAMEGPEQQAERILRSAECRC